MAKAHRPEITTLTAAQLDALLAELRPQVPAATYQLIAALLETLQWIMAAFEQKTISIARLKRLLFGQATETTAKVFPPQPQPDSASENAAGEPKAKRKGHGRNGAQDYPGAKRVKVAHPILKAGQLCPQCLRAKLYLLKTPARLVRIVAQPLFQATVHELERLRCALCGAVNAVHPGLRHERLFPHAVRHHDGQTRCAPAHHHLAGGFADPAPQAQGHSTPARLEC